MKQFLVLKPTRDTLLMLNKSAPYSNKEKVREEDTVKIKFLSCSQWNLRSVWFILGSVTCLHLCTAPRLSWKIQCSLVQAFKNKDSARKKVSHENDTLGKTWEVTLVEYRQLCAGTSRSAEMNLRHYQALVQSVD